MNETFDPDGAPRVPWVTSDPRLRGSGTAEKSPTAASLNGVTPPAHEAVDRSAGSAAPEPSQMGDSVAGAEAALHQQAAQLRRTRDEWAEGMRSTVRSHPLAAVAAAVALGAVIVRVTR